MKKVEYIIIACFILLVSTCKKEADPGEYILAGIIDDSFYHFEFSPDKTIAISWDSLNLYGFGKDSLDLDNDGNFDLVFNLQIINNDSLHLLDGLPNPFPYLYVIHRNSAGISTLTETFYSGLGSTGTATYANAFMLNDKIYKNGEWSEVDEESQNLWGDNPSNYYPKGKWFNLNETGFLGVRINEKLAGLRLTILNYTIL